ncbi:MAG: hypothetical protein ACXAC7_16735 [Candidatus Hodarchaeales archaeon]|jgi:hypothetical protein
MKISYKTIGILLCSIGVVSVVIIIPLPMLELNDGTKTYFDILIVFFTGKPQILPFGEVVIPLLCISITSVILLIIAKIHLQETGANKLGKEVKLLKNRLLLFVGVFNVYTLANLYRRIVEYAERTSSEYYEVGIYLALGGSIMLLFGAILLELYYREVKKQLAYVKIVKVLPEMRPNVPIALSRFVQLVGTSITDTENIIKSILLDQPELGEYLELEQIFTKNDDTSAIIDALLGKFEEKGVKDKV